MLAEQAFFLCPEHFVTFSGGVGKCWTFFNYRASLVRVHRRGTVVSASRASQFFGQWTPVSLTMAHFRETALVR